MSDERKTQDHTAARSPTEAASKPADSRSKESTARSDRRGDVQTGDVQTATAAAERTSAPQAAENSHQDSPQRDAERDLTKAPAKTPTEPGVYFFPDRVVTESEARRMLASDSEEDRVAVISRLLTYAEYDVIWAWTDRDTVRELFDQLDLPERLRAAWARNLGLVTQSG